MTRLPSGPEPSERARNSGSARGGITGAEVGGAFAPGQRVIYTRTDTFRTTLLRDFVQCLEWLHPDEGAIQGPCEKETPETCCTECCYLGCIDKKLRAAKEALSDELAEHEVSADLTRAEFDRLLTACMDTYAQAVLAHFRNGTDYEERLDKATEARAALIKAVFP